MNRFLVIIVIYKRNLQDVAPLNYFNKLSGDETKIYIYDNSPAPLMKSDIPDDFVYVHDSSNGGISKAYNSGARYARENGYNWLILFDQDTEIENDYLSLLRDCMLSYASVGLFTPIVYYDQGVMSPKVCHYFRPSSESLTIGKHQLNNVSIINSGLVVRTADFYKCGGYNDDVFLDFADYQFIERLEKVLPTFVVFGGSLRQDFSNNEFDREKLYSRFTKYCECLKAYRTSGFRRLMLYYTGFLHSLSLYRRTQSIRFITHYVRTIL